MLTTYDRVLREWRRQQMCGSDLRAKLLEARLERDKPSDTGDVVPGIVVALTIKRAAEKVAIVACVMLTLVACTSHTPVRNSHVWDAATIVQPQQDYLLDGRK